jgi:hypothetical protein
VQMQMSGLTPAINLKDESNHHRGCRSSSNRRLQRCRTD